MADVQIEDGIIKVVQLDIQDPKAAAVLAEYPQVRWPEITRRALKIGLGYLKGGGKDYTARVRFASSLAAGLAKQPFYAACERF
jgi:hypothetical protein